MKRLDGEEKLAMSSGVSFVEEVEEVEEVVSPLLLLVLLVALSAAGELVSEDEDVFTDVAERVHPALGPGRRVGGGGGGASGSRDGGQPLPSTTPHGTVVACRDLGHGGI
jgi:hypothetical protein